MPSVTVKGMRCEHCRKSVTEALSKVPGVASAEVDLQKGVASWTDADPAAPVALEAVKKAITAIGFEAE